MELKAKIRTKLGRQVKALRRAGFLPAVLYGEGLASQSVEVPFREFEKAHRETGESTLLKLEVDEKIYNVLIHAIEHDALTGRPIHADFLAVAMDKKIQISVPLHFAEESPAVKSEGGVLVKVVQEVKVEALPGDLPHELTVNLGALTSFESRIFIKNIQLPKGVKILADDDEVVALVEPPRSEEELESLKEVPTAEVKEVKTEQEVKRAEEETKLEEEVEVKE